MRRLEALADGVLDAGLLVRYESLRAENERSQAWTDKQLARMKRGMAQMASEVAERPWCHGERYSLADIALAPLERAGVVLADTRRVPDDATGIALIVVGPDGDKGIIAAANANVAWSEDDEDRVRSLVAAAPPGSVLAVDLEIPRKCPSGLRQLLLGGGAGISLTTACSGSASGVAQSTR